MRHRRDRVPFFSDLVAQVFDVEILDRIGVVFHLVALGFDFPIGVGGFFRNAFLFRDGQVRKLAIMFSSAIDIQAHMISSI